MAFRFILDPAPSTLPGIGLRATGLILGFSAFLCTGVFGQTDTLRTVPDTLLTSPTVDTTAAGINPRIPIFTLTADDLDSELGNQDISGILQSSRDVFTATA